MMFLIFGYVMMSDQLQSIFKDTSTIDRLKKTELKKVDSSWTLLKNVFGNDNILWWFVPTQVHKEVSLESQY